MSLSRMQYRDAYAFFIFLVFIMVVFNYKDYTERLNKQSKAVKVKKISPLVARMSPVMKLNRTLTLQQSDNIAKCMKTYANSLDTSDKDVDFLDRHKYLNGNSLIVDVRMGDVSDIDTFISKFNPRKYVILEPKKTSYLDLKERLGSKSNVVIYNFGMSSKDDVYRLMATGNNKKETDFVHVVNAEDFLKQLGVGFYEVDLLNMNCAGCEFDILDTILSSTIIKDIKHIQFKSNKSTSIKDSARRYCQNQELLKATHSLMFSKSSSLESWVRKDLAQN